VNYSYDGKAMNQNFQTLYKQVCESAISPAEFITSLKFLPDFSDDLSQALLQELQKQNWSCLFKLIFAVQEFPNRKFTPVLIDLLDNHKDRGYSENIADALFDIRDERSVPALVRTLDYYEPGDDDRNVNKKVIYALARIRTKEAIDGLRVAAHNSDENIRTSAEAELRRLNESQLPPE
jgi:HEAT repeat protein